MAKCLVLGANGLIGSYIVDELVGKGHKVRSFDRYGLDKVNYKNADKVEPVAGDFLNRDDLKKALKGIDYVFHFISTTTPITAENDPLIDIETNIRMSVELLQLCVEAKIKRIIYPSTGGAVYGSSVAAGSAHKEIDPTLPVSPYAIGKLTVENYLHYFYRKFDLDYIVFRISNPYGSRQSARSKQGVIPIFLDHIHNQAPITVYGDGSMIRDYIYVQDLAHMIASVFNKKHLHRTYNLGSGDGNSVKEILECVEKVTGKKAIIHREPVPATFVDKVTLDTTRFTDEFHIKPTTTLEEGIHLTYQQMLKDGQ